MGEWKASKTLRFSKEELAMFGALQEKFSPFTATFTQTVVLCGRIVWRMFTSPGILHEIAEMLQRINCTKLQASAQLEIHFPPDPDRAFFPKIWSSKAAERLAGGSQ